MHDDKDFSYKMSRVHILWVYGGLGWLETMCISSFVRMGYEVSLWTYGGLLNPPHGVQVRDARLVLPESSVFLNQRQSYAGFSDLFRYAVLRRFGGLYSDADVVAMRPSHDLPTIPFLVTERSQQGGHKINGNVIHCPQPMAGDLMDLAFAYANVFPKDKVAWSEIGPALLTAIVNIHPQHGYQIMPPDFANVIDWWDCPRRLLGDEPVQKCFFLHLYNEMWRRAGVDKSRPCPSNSMLSRALAQVGVLPSATRYENLATRFNAFL